MRLKKKIFEIDSSAGQKLVWVSKCIALRVSVLSPVCLRLCICRWDSLKYLLLQPGWAQTNGRFSLPSDVFTAGGAILGARRTSLEENRTRRTNLKIDVWLLRHWFQRASFSPTDLDSSEDAVYVVLGTDQHGWRCNGRLSVIAVSVSAAGQRGKYLSKAKDCSFVHNWSTSWSYFNLPSNPIRDLTAFNNLLVFSGLNPVSLIAHLFYSSCAVKLKSLNLEWSHIVSLAETRKSNILTIFV